MNFPVNLYIIQSYGLQRPSSKAVLAISKAMLGADPVGATGAPLPQVH
jgi:hypothetical protein